VQYLSNLIPKAEYNIPGWVGGLAYGAALYPVLTQALGFKKSNAFVNATSLGYMMAKHYWGNLNDIKPACVIAGIPLGTVLELSHGISDREVRYRANGGVFLAHQTGGDESLRIVGRAWGENRFIFLNMLDLLFLWGSANIIDVFAQSLEAGAWNTTPTQWVNSQQPPLVNPSIEEPGLDPWESFEAGIKNKNEGYEEYHMTFPIITRQRVYLSMYIETYSWRQRLDRENRKMVEYTIFFRKYEPVPQYTFGKINIPDDKPGFQDTEVKVYKKFTQDEHPLLTAAMKGALEVTTTLLLYNEMFNWDNVSQFGSQFIRNYFGVDREEEGRIPGILETRGFF